MLYDKKWATQTKPVKPSLKGMIAWLEKKDPKKKYNYVSINNCAVAQYLKSIGQHTKNQRLGCDDINRLLGNKFNADRFPFHNTESKNFGELLIHLKRLDGQGS